LPIQNRLGPLTQSSLPGSESTIVVQPYFGYHELQVQFCDRRGWGVTARCPRLDALGIDNDVARPSWSETALPCGDRFYGGALVAE
jgi:hypothetical protein